MSPADLPDLVQLRGLVRDAARTELIPRFADVTRHLKTDGSVVTAADHTMQARMQRDLARHWPQYGFLGEEMTRIEQERLTREAETGLWCLDPLDGTSNFAAGLPFFAVSLALLVRSFPVLGLVYDPVRDECFMARRGAGAWLNDTRLDASVRAPMEIKRTVACVDFKRLDRTLAALLSVEPPYGSQRNFGSSSLEWCWLADGRFQLYLHGGQKLWDYAAGNLILAEAGGHAETIEGEEVFQLGLTPRSVVAVRDRRLLESWREWMSRHTTR